MKVKKNQEYIPDTVYQISIYRLFKNIGITKKSQSFYQLFWIKIEILILYKTFNIFSLLNSRTY